MGEPANRGRRSSSGGMMMHGVNLKRRFFVSLVLAVPILLLSSPMGLALPITLSFPGSDWLVAALATVMFVYGGWPFLRGAADEVRNRKPAMMTLVALGITTAYVYSMYAFAMGSVAHDGGMHMDFFWELATLIVIMLLGHWIEMRAVMGAGDALKEMAELLPAQAHVKQADGSFADVPLDEVQVGQTVMVEAGEKVPADGEVTDGSSSVNEALVTGEARAVEAHEGDTVFGGSQNGDGTLYVRVTGTGQSGYLAQVMQLVSQAQQEKSRAEVLGLAIPLVAARSTSLGARNGLLVRRRRALEVAPRVNVVMMDKTGTLTEGDFRVAEVRAVGKRSAPAGDASDAPNVPGAPADDRALALIAGLEQSSSHPLAASIVAAAQQRGVQPAAVLGFSLGQVSALAVSGMLSDEATFALVKARSELMAEAAAAHPGVMSALLKADEDGVAALCEQCAEGEVLVPANFNCPGQIVIAGAPAAVERAEAAWAEAGKRSSRLATSGAFHSPLMADAAAGLAAYLDNVEFSEARIPLVCNVTAAPLSAADARENLVRHLTSPVRFDASVAALTAAGADMFVEVGFGGVLANLVKRIDKTATRACVQDRASFDGCLAVASATDSE